MHLVKSIFLLAVGACSAQATLIGSYDWGTFPATAPGIATGTTPGGRPVFAGNPSSAAGGNSYPGSVGSGGYRYVTITSPHLLNASGSAQSIILDLQHGGTSTVGAYVYANSFDPAHLSANYLGTSGIVSSAGSVVRFGFLLPDAAQAVVVLFAGSNVPVLLPSGVTTVSTPVPEPASMVGVGCVLAILGVLKGCWGRGDLRRG